MSQNLENQNSLEMKCLEKVRERMSPENCFGLTDKNYKDLQALLSSAVPNRNSSEFPDFITNDGIIEHFSITSSAEGRKGSKQKAKSAKLYAESQRDFLLSLDTSEPNRKVAHSVNQNIEEHSRCNIVRSIKKNWEKHINSYDNSTYVKKHSIFLMEYIDSYLETAIESKGSCHQVFASYRISGDKEILNWIYDFKDKIEYLILFNENSLEIIRVDKLKELIESLPEAQYASVIGMESHKYVGIKRI